MTLSTDWKEEKNIIYRLERREKHYLPIRKKRQNVIYRLERRDKHHLSFGKKRKTLSTDWKGETTMTTNRLRYTVYSYDSNGQRRTIDFFSTRIWDGH